MLSPQRKALTTETFVAREGCPVHDSACFFGLTASARGLNPGTQDGNKKNKYGGFESR